MSGGDFAEQLLREAHEGHGPRSRGLNELRDEARRIAEAHGFRDATIGEDVALMHSELSELLEDHRAGKLAHEMMYERKIEIEPKVVDEIRSHVSRLTGGLVKEPEVRFVTVLTDERSHREDGREVLHKPVGIPSEIADIIIRALHFSGKHGINVEAAVTEKMAYNATRTHMHGGKKL